MAFYDSINLEKGMYHVAGKNFTEVLEGLDSSENYRNTPLEGLDAYERQLKRFDIRVSGPKSDVVEKFFFHYGFRRPVPGICLPLRSPGDGGSKPA